MKAKSNSCQTKHYLHYIMRIIITVALILIANCGPVQKVHAQKIAAKTNIAHWAVGVSPNLALEFALGKKVTLEVGGGLNRWTFGENKKIKHWLIQPEVRYWFFESFNGHFIGLHAHGAEFNVGNFDVPVGRLDIFENKRYEGYLYGAGLSYGYQWMLNKRWSLEVSLGAGYARIDYDKFDGPHYCGEKLDEGKENYLGVTKVALSFIYFFK